MPLTYLQYQALGTTDTYTNRLVYAARTYANVIVAESPSTTDHVARLNWAVQVIADAPAMVQKMLDAINADATIADNPPAASDADLQTATEAAADALIAAGLSYKDLAAIAASTLFLNRVSPAIAKFAATILGESSGTTNHANRYQWALQAQGNTPAFAISLAPAVTMDSTLADGPLGVDDATLQTAVETQATLMILV